MKIVNAVLEDSNIIKRIVDQTISQIYPTDYSKEGVRFFIHQHHCANIKYDLLKHPVYLMIIKDTPITTGTIVGQ